MAPDTGTAENLPPIFVSVKDAARMLAISPWSTYKLLEDGDIDSVYRGRRRLVDLESLHRYAASLPSTKPDKNGESA